jgi:lysophospholipase L1-like esterase
MTAKTLALFLALVGCCLPAAMAAVSMKPIDLSTRKSPVRVACIGDSITEGAGTENGKSYPAQLQNLLGPSWQIGNFGLSGRTLLKKGDFPYWNEKKYQERSNSTRMS